MPRRPTHPAPPLFRRVALVTGGARRVGRAIVLALADAGADVAIHAHRSGREARALARAVEARGRRAAVLTGDLADPIVARALPLGAADVLGRLDVLVHNAAVFAPTDPRSADAAAWDAMMDVNARAAWLLTSAAAPLLERRGGAVVHVACASAASPWAGFLPYSASKAAVVALTKGFAKAFAPSVRVNAVAPGPILPAEGSTPARDQAAIDATLLKRWGRVEDIVAAIRYLVVDAPYVTGAVLPVDGGRHLKG